MDVPGRIGHNHVEFSQYFEIEISQVAVYPLSVKHPLPGYYSFLGHLGLLILFDVVNQFAVRVVAGVQMRTISKTLVRLLVYYRPEMLLRTQGVPFGLLTTVSGAVIAVLQIFL